MLERRIESKGWNEGNHRCERKGKRRKRSRRRGRRIKSMRGKGHGGVESRG